MAVNKGKQWEAKINEDFSRLPESTIDRLYDPEGGKAGIHNVSDFIGYVYPYHFYIEAKSCKGNTFPLTNLKQYDKLKYKVGIKGVRAGVFLWFIEHKAVCYVPISTITQMKKDGKKSVNIKMLSNNEYNIKIIPSITKRVFPECDYSVLMELKDGE